MFARLPTGPRLALLPGERISQMNLIRLIGLKRASTNHGRRGGRVRRGRSHPASCDQIAGLLTPSV